MRNKMLTIVITLQLLYILMFRFNLVGYLNVMVNNLGYLLWIVVAVSSLIFSELYFFKKDRKVGIYIVVISFIEVIFTIFISILPYIVGIPF